MASIDTRHYTSGEGPTSEESAVLKQGAVPISKDTVRAFRLGASTGFSDGFEYGRAERERKNSAKPDIEG